MAWKIAELFVEFVAKGVSTVTEALAKVRWEYVTEGRQLTEQELLSLVASAWLNKDTRFALYVGKTTGVTLTGTTKVETQEQVQELVTEQN